MSVCLIRFALYGLAAAVVLLASSQGWAQFKADSEAPIEVTADSMEWLQEQRIAIARGNADAVQGRYTLHADVLTAHMTEVEGSSTGDIRRIDAKGHVVLTTPDEKARGEAGVYDVEKGVAVLVGSVVLIQGDSVLRGERLVMNLETGRSTLEGAAGAPSGEPAGGRVRAIFNTAKDTDNAKKAGRANK